MSRKMLGGFLAGCFMFMVFQLVPAEGQHLNEVDKQLGRPVLRVPKPSTAPVIDGKLDDPCWKVATPVTLGMATGAWWEEPSQKTEARVLADDKAIYFAVRCFESDPDRIVASGTARKGMIVGADAVEFFLDPGCRKKRDDYFHFIVTPKETIYKGRGQTADAWKASITAKVGKVDGGWTVEAAVPLADLELKEGAIPKVWGLNVCRQRPELGAVMPKAAKDAGKARLKTALYKLDEPKKYRLPEYTSWSPTMADFCGYPFYSDSRPFHFVDRFGHAQFEVGTQDVAPPVKLFEALFRSDFDDGAVGPFKNAIIRDENFRGPGKSLGFAAGQRQMRLAQPLADLEDVTLIMTMKGPATDEPLKAYLRLAGVAADGTNCGAERYELFLTPAEAEARTKYLNELTQKGFGASVFELYDTHADMIRWKPVGRARKGPGPWAMVEGYFAEPSVNQLRWPGKDWVIVRIRLGLFRRSPGPNGGQRLVPREQNYPNGLVLSGFGRNDVRIDEQVRIDDVVIFRGQDVEPPARVTGVKVQRNGEGLDLSWERARDNTLTAYYRIYAGKDLVAETHKLSVRLGLATVKDAPLTVVAVDLYGNASQPSDAGAR